MKIDKIKKINGDKYKLHLSNHETVTTYDEVIIKNNLLFHNEIDSDLLNKIELDTQYYGIYNKVIKYITTRLRSKKEVLVYLEKCGVLDKEKEKIVEQLVHIGLVNDLNFTKAYINDRMYLGNYGPEKIKSDLYSYDIEPNIIETEILNINNEVVKDKLIKLVEKKVKGNRKYSGYQLRQKLILELVNMGYNREMIGDIFDSFNTNSNDVLNKQFDKIYNKLSKKYTGQELYYKIRQSLYQKGFDISEIDSLLNEKVEIS